MNKLTRLLRLSVLAVLVFAVSLTGCAHSRLNSNRVLVGPSGLTSPVKGESVCLRQFHGYHPTAWKPLECFGPVAESCAPQQCETEVISTTSSIGVPTVQGSGQATTIEELTMPVDPNIPFWLDE